MRQQPALLERMRGTEKDLSFLSMINDRRDHLADWLLFLSNINYMKARIYVIENSEQGSGVYHEVAAACK